MINPVSMNATQSVIYCLSVMERTKPLSYEHEKEKHGKNVLEQLIFQVPMDKIDKILSQNMKQRNLDRTCL